MRRVLLIKSGIENSRSTGITPPLGLMYIASYINQHSEYQIKIFDSRLYKDYLQYIKDLYHNFQPDVIGISALTLEAPRMFQMAELIKSLAKNITVIVGGPHFTSAPEEVIRNHNIDIGIIGEGEITFAEILEALCGDRTLNTIDGICFRNDNELLAPHIKTEQLLLKHTTSNDNHVEESVGLQVQALSNPIIRTRERAYIENLDTLPYPAWDAIELEQYAKRRSMSPVGLRPYMALLTSRGCPYKCTYCHNIFGKYFRARSVGNVLNEIEILINKYHINDFEIIDDISNFNRERIKSICHGIINNEWHVRLSFPNGVRTDILDEETILLLKKAGTVQMSIAVETASQRLQRLVKKNLNLDKVKRAIDIAANNRIFLTGFFMFGFPTETESELKATIEFACKSKLHLALFFVLHPFKGTEIVKQIEQTGKQLPDIDLKEFDYYIISFNPSSIENKKFHRLFTWAYLRFYLNPSRIFRILRDKPLHNDLLLRVITTSLFFLRSPKPGSRYKKRNFGFYGK